MKSKEEREETKDGKKSRSTLPANEDRRVIARVTTAKTGQRRVNIPKDDKTLKDKDWVEVRKVEII